MLKNNLCGIFKLMTELENSPSREWKNILRGCSEDFLWDMSYAYGCSPNDDKEIMIERILKHQQDAIDEKIKKLKELMNDVRIAFNCWTDNGKLNVNKAYERCYDRLEAWLLYFKSEEKKS